MWYGIEKRGIYGDLGACQLPYMVELDDSMRHGFGKVIANVLENEAYMRCFRVVDLCFQHSLKKGLVVDTTFFVSRFLSNGLSKNASSQKRGPSRLFVFKKKKEFFRKLLGGDVGSIFG